MELKKPQRTFFTDILIDFEITSGRFLTMKTISKLKATLFLTIALFFIIPFFFTDSLMGGGFSIWRVYFYIVSAIMFFFIGIILLVRKEKLTIRANRLDAAVILFWLWSFGRLVFTPDLRLFDEKIVELFFLSAFYFTTKVILRNESNSSFSYYKLLVLVFLCCGFVEAGIGILQTFNNNLFALPSDYIAVGSFENPDYFAGYMAVVIPFSLGVFMFSTKDGRWNKILRCTGLGTFLAGILALQATRSRGSWLAVVISCIFLVIIKRDIITKIKSSFKFKILSAVLGIGTLTLLMVFAYHLFTLKPDSANGRILIWKITLNMIRENPIAGIGFDKYKVEYENYQGNYFASGKGTAYEEKLAGHVFHAYNEPLQIVTELGLIGGVLFFLIVGFALFGPQNQDSKNNSELYFARASILAFIVYSSFSFPMSILPTFLSFFFMLAVISEKTFPNKSIFISQSIQKFFGGCSLLIAIWIGWHSHDVYVGYRDWQSAYQLTASMDLDEAQSRYQKLFPLFQNDGEFLFTYGGALALAGKYNEAIPHLEAAKSSYNDPNLWLALGQSYEAIGNNKKAEEHYYKAAAIIPHKFFPKYLLIKIYLLMGKTDKAIALGQKFMKMEVKVPSHAILEMKEEISELLRAHQLSKNNSTPKDF